MSRGMCQHIEVITRGAPREKAYSKGTMKRKIVELKAINKKD